MSLKFTPHDAHAFATLHAISLTGVFIDPHAPCAWRCQEGHLFSISLHSLQRRVRQGVIPCPVCSQAEKDRSRQEQEFTDIVAAAGRTGLSVTSPVSAYLNQHSKLSVTCGSCDPCTAAPMSAAKIKGGQGCAIIGREKSAAARRLSFDAVQHVVADHPMGLTLLSGPDHYQNNLTPLLIGCLNGHNFEASVSDLQRRDRIRGCPDCAQNKGQAVATAILSALLGVEPLVEYSPAFLLRDWLTERGPLRLDAFFPEVKANGQTMSVAFEYQGAQHFDPEHHFHKKSCHGAGIAFRRLQEGDEHKVAACAAEPGVVLVVLADDGAETLTALCVEIADALEAVLPELYLDADYQERLKALADSDHLHLVLRDALISSSNIERLARQLDDREINLVSYDPVAGRASCKCRVCNHEWDARENNLLDGVSTDRTGTGCPRCNIVQRGRKKRLAEITVVERASKAGWIPLWLPGTYAGQTQKLDWACAKPGCTGQRHSDFDHLLRRTCRVCKTLGAEKQNGQK